VYSASASKKFQCRHPDRPGGGKYTWGTGQTEGDYIQPGLAEWWGRGRLLPEAGDGDADGGGAGDGEFADTDSNGGRLEFLQQALGD